MRAEHVFQMEKSGKRLDVYVDEWPDNPRENGDNLGQLLCWHRRYELGSKEEVKAARAFDPSNYGGWADLEAAIEREFKPVVILPVYMLDHSGIALSTASFNDRWDSGQVGFIFATRESVTRWFNKKRITKDLRDKVEAQLRSEVDQYGKYVNGDVYAAVVTDLVSGEEVDSLCGIYCDNVREIANDLL